MPPNLRLTLRTGILLASTAASIGTAGCAGVSGPTITPLEPDDPVVVGLVAPHDGFDGSHDRYAAAIRDARAALDHVVRCGGLARPNVHLYVADRVTLGERTVERLGDATMVLAQGPREPAVVALGAGAAAGGDPVAAVADVAARYLDAPACAPTRDG